MNNTFIDRIPGVLSLACIGPLTNLSPSKGRRTRRIGVREGWAVIRPEIGSLPAAGSNSASAEIAILEPTKLRLDE
jgi:hypothetical protein